MFSMYIHTSSRDKISDLKFFWEFFFFSPAFGKTPGICLWINRLTYHTRRVIKIYPVSIVHSLITSNPPRYIFRISRHPIAFDPNRYTITYTMLHTMIIKSNDPLFHNVGIYKASDTISYLEILNFDKGVYNNYSSFIHCNIISKCYRLRTTR